MCQSTVMFQTHPSSSRYEGKSKAEPVWTDKPDFPLNRTKDTKNSPLQPFLRRSVKALVIAQRERGAYVKVVLQGLGSGRSAGGETIVVLINAPVSQKFLYFSSRVSQLTSDGAELL